MCGVPQGSILGPTLFLLYINELCKITTKMKFILFADDTNIICADDNLEQLLASVTVELIKLKTWFNINKLSLNLNKTKIMLFSNRKCNIPVKIVIDDTLIEKVQQNTFLGVIIDEKISWKPHISYLRKKVAKCVGMMKRVCNLLNTKARLVLYHSFVMPYLYYCVEIWGNCYKTHLQPLITLQKKAIRIVSGVHHRHHSNPWMWSILKLVKLCSGHLKILCLPMFKIYLVIEMLIIVTN